MNENEVERLLKTYGSSFAPCKAPEHTRRVIRWNRRATFGLASASILALSIVGLWPRNAVAGTVAQINAALRDVKTMECDLSVKLPSGWHTIVRTYYANECWRFDSQIGTNLETVDIVKDGQRLVDCTRDERQPNCVRLREEGGRLWRNRYPSDGRGERSRTGQRQANLCVIVRSRQG